MSSSDSTGSVDASLESVLEASKRLSKDDRAKLLEELSKPEPEPEPSACCKRLASEVDELRRMVRHMMVPSTTSSQCCPLLEESCDMEFDLSSFIKWFIVIIWIVVLFQICTSSTSGLRPMACPIRI